MHTQFKNKMFSSLADKIKIQTEYVWPTHPPSRFFFFIIAKLQQKDCMIRCQVMVKLTHYRHRHLDVWGLNHELKWIRTPVSISLTLLTNISWSECFKMNEMALNIDTCVSIICNMYVTIICVYLILNFSHSQNGNHCTGKPVSTTG